MTAVDRHKGAGDGLEGLHVLVTGGAQGIGAALVEALWDAGARISVLDCDGPGLETLAHGCEGDRLRVDVVDVSEAAQVNAAIARAESAFGGVERLASVAGVLQMGRTVDLSDAQWARAFAVNVNGPFHVCRAVVPGMMARRRGAIVAVSSNAAATPRLGMGAYAASKAALTQLMRCLALEVADFGIRCNIVSPGSTDTEMQRAMWRQGSSRETVIEGDLQHHRLGIPLRKIATPAEVADSVLFLLSDRASHITLHDLRVDGGATLDQG